MDFTYIEIFGFFIVLIFCISYFNEPKYSFADEKDKGKYDVDRVLEPALPKFMTNRYQYNIYLLLFIIFTEIFYLILTGLLPLLLDMDTPKSADYNALVSALIITGFLPNLPFVKDLLNKAKNFLHERAKIPSEGRGVYQTLKSRRIHYNNETKNEIINDKNYADQLDPSGKASRKDLAIEDFDARTTSMENKWAKLSWLIHHLKEWERTSPFSSYIFNKELRWASIKDSYNYNFDQTAFFLRGKEMAHGGPQKTL